MGAWHVCGLAMRSAWEVQVVVWETRLCGQVGLSVVFGLLAIPCGFILFKLDASGERLYGCI